jgi:endonuclease G
MRLGFSAYIWLCALLIASPSAQATIDVDLQMQLGNPSGATGDTNNHDHYLIQRTVEAIDFSDHLGEPVWASWDLTASDVGSATRSTSYYTDTNLPPNFYRVTDSDYNGVGNIDFNRGHLCPSEDRTDTSADNKLVFFLTNIMPQSGPNNQGVWGNLETYCRSMLTTNELLIICGPSEFGTNKIPSGKAYIGSNVWKIVVCVPLGSGMELSRIGATNRVIAVSIPNVTNGLSSAWQTYVTSPLQIEHDTGFHFFTALPPDVAQALRLKIDGKASVPLLSAVNLASTGFSFTVTGNAGSNYVVQVSTNLASENWIPVLTNAAPFSFVDSAVSVPSQRFYRAIPK